MHNVVEARDMPWRIWRLSRLSTFSLVKPPLRMIAFHNWAPCFCYVALVFLPGDIPSGYIRLNYYAWLPSSPLVRRSRIHSDPSSPSIVCWLEDRYSLFSWCLVYTWERGEASKKSSRIHRHSKKKRSRTPRLASIVTVPPSLSFSVSSLYLPSSASLRSFAGQETGNR